MVSHANLLGQLDASANRSASANWKKTSRRRPGVSGCRAYHDMGLIGGILTAIHGRPQRRSMSPTSFLQRPMRLAASDQRRLQTGSSAGARILPTNTACGGSAAEERATLDLSRWRLAFCGARTDSLRDAGATSPRRFGDAGFKFKSFLPAAWSGRVARCWWRGRLSRGADDSARQPCRAGPASGRSRLWRTQTPMIQRLVGCGAGAATTRSSSSIRNTAPKSATARSGEILVQGPIRLHKVTGIVPEETGAGIRRDGAGSREADSCATGDLGFFRDGELFVTGRVKDVIIIRGRNHLSAGHRAIGRRGPSGA